MTSFDPAHAVAASIVPFEPTVGIAVVASAFLVGIVAFMVYLAVAPMVSDSWVEDAEVHGHASESSTAD